MSDDFIPFNQSTPVQGKWQDRRQNQSQPRHQNNRYQNGNRRGNGHSNRWGNNSQRNNSLSVRLDERHIMKFHMKLKAQACKSDCSNMSFGRDKNNIDAYLHPSMLQDPWEHLRQASE